LPISFGTAFAFREDASYGKVYEYRFNKKELKAPRGRAGGGLGLERRGVR
jgi:hypothetical protein